MDVLDLLVPKHSAVAIGRIIGEQLAVVLQMRPTTTRVSDDRVKLLWRKLLKLFSRKLLRQFPFTIMRVKRPAADLHRRRNHFATIPRQHLHGIAIDVAENK